MSDLSSRSRQVPSRQRSAVTMAVAYLLSAMRWAEENAGVMITMHLLGSDAASADGIHRDEPGPRARLGTGAHRRGC